MSVNRKIRCHTCFNLMTYCHCGLPEPEATVSDLVIVTDDTILDLGLDMAEMADLVAVVDQVTAAFSDEVGAARMRHPSYDVVEEAERILLEVQE